MKKICELCGEWIDKGEEKKISCNDTAVLCNMCFNKEKLRMDGQEKGRK